jgi:acetoin utilization deacetylase AcuC-like enzyme
MSESGAEANRSRRDFLVRTGAAWMGLGLGPPDLAALPGDDVLQHLNAGTGARRSIGTGFIYDARYLEHVLPLRRGEPHPERPLRLVRIREELTRRGLDEQLVSMPLLADPRPFIESHHTSEHVAAVREIEITGPVAELAVGGALGGVDAVARGLVRNAFCAVRPPGHHANNTGSEEGFCFYSNAAIAARYAQSVHGFEKVLIIDWDYHHGNATQDAFYDDSSVLFFSTHDWNAYPGTGDPALGGTGAGENLNINVHLECGASDRDMLSAWDRQLLLAASTFSPDLVIISAGFDSRKDDLLGCFEVTDDAFRRMTGMAMELADDCCEGRLVSLLEGGYNVDGTAVATAAHIETLLDHS